MKNLTLNARIASLMPIGIPCYIRCYDAGPDGPMDRYTVVFSKRPAFKSAEAGTYWLHLGMSTNPCHPQGFGQHEETRHLPCDRPTSKHLGKKIEFTELPAACQTLVVSTYRDHWDLNPPMVTVVQACNFMRDTRMSPASRLKLRQVADKAAKKFGNLIPFQYILTAWHSVPDLAVFADIAEHQAYATNQPFV